MVTRSLCGFQPLRRRNGVRLAGEIDCSNVWELTGALDDLLRDRDAYVDMSTLQFVDVGGVRALVEEAGRREPRRLVLVDPHPLVLQILDTCGWTTSPGLSVANADSWDAP